MNVASSRSERTADPRASAALMTIMLVMAGMTAGIIEHAAARAVESANRDYRMVDRGMTASSHQWSPIHCQDHPQAAISDGEHPATPGDLAHLAGSARDLERTLRNLPPPTIA